MSDRHIFPRGDKDFNDYVVLAIAYLLANSLALGVSAANQASLPILLASWNKNWGAFLDPTQHTSVITTRKDNQRVQLETALRSVYGDIPQSALDEDSRSVLNLAAHDTTHTRVAPLDVAPGIATETTVHLLHTLRFQNPETPESKAMPEGQKIILESFVGAPDLKDPAVDFGNEMNVTTFLAKVAFTDDQVGQTCYYRSCYESTHGERGPWSLTLAVVIG